MSKRILGEKVKRSTLNQAEIDGTDEVWQTHLETNRRRLGFTTKKMAEMAAEIYFGAHTGFKAFAVQALDSLKNGKVLGWFRRFIAVVNNLWYSARGRARSLATA